MVRDRGFFLAGLALALASCVLADASPRVALNGLGTLIGTEGRTRENRPIHSFQGIPFAEPPSGPNRFKAPIPKKWSGKLYATRLGIACPQPPYEGLMPEKSETARAASFSSDPEDCLTLNVYTPDLTHKALLPVVIFFHGGAFITGSAAEFGPEYLLERDVVLVVPQYRIGAFGFLAANNDIIPGNAGLLDALESLRWVKKHIGKFGGNVRKITVAGHSAGASIVNFLMLSPLAKGLIHGAIMNSGTAQADWAINRNPDYDLKGVASKLRCLGKHNNETDNQMIASCLMRRRAGDLLKAHTRHYAAANLKAASPVISRPDEPESTKIVPDEPSMLAKPAKDVPLLIGVTRHESMWMVNILVKFIKTSFLPTETFYRTFLFPKIYSLAGIRDDKLHMVDFIYKKQFFSYALPKDMANLTVIVPGLVDLLSTVTMKNPAAQVPKNNTRVKNFLYSFEYDGRLHVPGNGIGDSPTSLFKKGTPHGDDMVYLTPKPDIKEPFNEEEVAFSKKMVDMWANFIISGNPNVPKKVTDPEWPRYEYFKDKLYYKIGRVNKVGTDFTSEFYTVVNDFVTNPK